MKVFQIQALLQPWSRCNRTEQLPVYFNCLTFWPRQEGLSWTEPFQTQVRQNFHFRVGHKQEIYRIDMLGRDEEHAQWCLCPYMGDQTTWQTEMVCCHYSHFKFSFVDISVVLQDKNLILTHIIHYIQIITQLQYLSKI